MPILFFFFHADLFENQSMACQFAYLVGAFVAGGLERQLIWLLGAMDRRRYEPTVLIWNPAVSDFYLNDVEALGVPVHPVPGRSIATKLHALRGLVRELRPEVLHAYTFYLNFPAYVACAGTSTLPVGSIRNEYHVEKRNSGAVRGWLSGRWPAAQVSNCEAGAEGARRWGGPFTPRRLFVVRNGLDLERFSTRPRAGDGVVEIVGVGSLIARKRWDRLLHAACALRDRGHAFQVRIFGQGVEEGPLRRLAAELGLDDRVRFEGLSHSVPEVLAGADFAVHTADYEGCPNAVMEAMACGRAVVATDAGDVPALIEEGQTGFVVRRGDDQALLDRMETLMTDRDRCRRMGEAARRKAERELTLDRLVRQTLDVYRALGWRGE